MCGINIPCDECIWACGVVFLIRDETVKNRLCAATWGQRPSGAPRGPQRPASSSGPWRGWGRWGRWGWVTCSANTMHVEWCSCFKVKVVFVVTSSICANTEDLKGHICCICNLLLKDESIRILIMFIDSNTKTLLFFSFPNGAIADKLNCGVISTQNGRNYVFR